MRFTSLGRLLSASSLAAVGRQAVGWGASRETLFLATRRRLLTLTSLAIAIVATVWMASSIGTIAPNRVWFTAFCAVVPLLFYPFPFLANRPGVDFDILAHAFVALLFGLTAFVAASLGGAISMTSFFMVLVATLATLLLGMRAGVVWLTVVIACYAWLHVSRPSLPQPTYPLSWDDISFWNALTLSFVAIALCAAVAIFQVAVRQSSELLAAAAKERSALDEARRVAEEVGRTRAEFIANMSHELRTPLNAIVGYGEMLRETAAEDGRSEDIVDTDRILGAAAHLLQMVNDVLRLSESETGATSIGAHDIDALLGEVVRESQAARARAQGHAALATRARRRLALRRRQHRPLCAQSSVQRHQVHPRRCDRSRRLL